MSYEIVEQWKRTGLLNGISEQHVESMAYLFENQRLYNESPEAAEMTPEFRRCSIPFCRRVPDVINTHKIRVESYLTDTFSRFMETDILFKLPKPEGLSGTEVLESEAEGVARISEQLGEVMANFAKANKAKVVYLEGFGLENGKIVVFYQI